ncbi:sulfatase [Kiritimatiella glycovorans]|uniref:Arylsulfatase n=1 Tax=Kiritimatiella glycovorans TaxID=1307763 RepID=A0A0G3EDW5_9BACT|nr:sulfatase [Kiritimatiella glycovorans]AKJ63607.1 Arylsulfatase [Kiritimatiella glycovorans]
MERRSFLTGTSAGAIAAFGMSGLTRGAPGGRPNIIFLMTDDQRKDTLGCYGNAAVKTPHLDAMAAEGTAFENAFVVTSICVASRATVLTGQYMRTHGIRDFIEPFTEDQVDATYPAILRRHGYYTGFIGKWGVGATHPEHLKSPAGRFDFWRGVVGQGKYYPDPRQPEKHMTEIMGDDAVEFVEQASGQDKPFCLSVSFKACHGPWDGYDRRLDHLYDPEDMPVPELFSAEAFDAQPKFLQDSIAGEQGSIAREWGWGRNPTLEHHHRHMKQYFTLVSGVDRQVGRLRQRLSELGLADNTILIYTSDQGHFEYEYGFHGKWFMYEPSIRIPLLVFDPRSPENLRGQRREEMVLNVDYAQTILSLAGVEAPATMQGRDLTPLVRGRHPAWRKDWFYEHTYEPAPGDIPKSVGVRTERWKYVRFVSVDPVCEQLFDLAEDPLEMNNLAEDPAQKGRLEALRARCDQYRREIPDRHPVYAEYPEFVVVNTAQKQHEQSIDFAQHPHIGQTFRAETGRLHAIEFQTPAWGRPYGVADLVVELFHNGRKLGEQTIPARRLGNQFRQRVIFDAEVPKHARLFVRMHPTKKLPKQTLALWAFHDDPYRFGTAYTGDNPQNYDMEMRFVFRR